MAIYTRTGDDGTTGLFAGPRVAKDHPRIEACGTVDELNAALGLARAAQPPSEIDRLLCRIQHELFALGAQLATPAPAASKTELIGDLHVAALEADIDRFDQTLPPLKNFILPAGVPAAAAIHLARCVCRRAERRVVSMGSVDSSPVSPLVIRYLNRHGDLLFVLARSANAASSQADVPWQKPESVTPP